MKALDRTFAALADPARLRVIALLREGPRRSSDLAAALRLPRPAMSRHLRILHKSGLVTESPVDDDARIRMYRLRPQPFREVRSWLEDVEAFWGIQLDTFKAHVEAKYGKPGKHGKRK